VTKGFNSKNNCDARTYSYTLPTIALADHKNEQPIELEKFRIPDERFKKFNEILKMYEGTLNFHNFTSKKYVRDDAILQFSII
jgi:tRNA pseudouridine38-40 synthase